MICPICGQDPCCRAPLPEPVKAVQPAVAIAPRPIGEIYEEWRSDKIAAIARALEAQQAAIAAGEYHTAAAAVMTALSGPGFSVGYSVRAAKVTTVCQGCGEDLDGQLACPACTTGGEG